MKRANRTALLLLIPLGLTGWSGISFAYRPFDSTDAAVADVGQLEVELGPVQFGRSDEERTVIAPAYVINWDFAKNWELVLEGRGEHEQRRRNQCIENGAARHVAMLCLSSRPFRASTAADRQLDARSLLTPPSGSGTPN